MDKKELKIRAQNLRSKGSTYLEIQELLNTKIPKSTLSYWCRGLDLPMGYQQRIEDYNKFNLKKAQEAALISNKARREIYLKKIDKQNLHLIESLNDKDTVKIALAILYAAEGSKSTRSSIMLGNSSPSIINLFLRLLRSCYTIDESKFRCTLQCRADQNIQKLEEFWSDITKIPLTQFYKAQIDPRTIDKPSKKPDYKGVCRIDYFSGEIFLDLTSVIKIICLGH
ncbi:MAG: hypothetical protein PHT44_01265 [Candidatus Portnoybacteria bacterium]|nr:hypothetical protein [Candidatus Portnoybacteria bacterium]MDD4982769.1 hypothetical protein [Candidatus Portnoybacteria bacterium]